MIYLNIRSASNFMLKQYKKKSALLILIVIFGINLFDYLLDGLFKKKLKYKLLIDFSKQYKLKF